MYSLQTSTGCSFDIYLSDDMNKKEKQEFLNKQFRVLFPDFFIDIEQKEYGFLVVLKSQKNFIEQVLAVVKQ